MEKEVLLLNKSNSYFKSQNNLIKIILKELDYFINYDFNSDKEEATIHVSFTKKEYKISYNRELGLIYCNFLEKPIHCPDIRLLFGSVHLILCKICKFHNYPLHRVVFTINKTKNVEELFFIVPETEDEEVAEKGCEFLEFAEEVNLYGFPEDVLVKENQEYMTYILENFYDFNFSNTI